MKRLYLERRYNLFLCNGEVQVAPAWSRVSGSIM